MEDHFGNQSLPPIWKQRVKELGKWVRKEYEINGKWWDSNFADIVAASLDLDTYGELVGMETRISDVLSSSEIGTEGIKGMELIRISYLII
ncbi:GTP binding domain-containing protein [Artemisia annua]|uniref:GTP binding domain-containing protein n=1 Tax=Artemisia annua TaxID=35608 RepID=A0A2U1NCY7_ARTAN|nr:GTP binding domain-containing protein [Artemisia annua]